MSSTFDLASVERAAALLAGRIVTTPLLESPQLNDRAGCRVLVKAESLQLTGSFKIRGALTHALSLSEEERANGLIAFSAGNHGQGVAAAARQIGVPAVVVMPRTAPQVKVHNCRWWGAEVVLYDPATEDREDVAARFVTERGMALVPPFDDPLIMSGQGTVGLEIVAELEARGIVPDELVLNCSGGGLAAGVAEVMRAAHPHLGVSLVEPAGRDKMAQAIAADAAGTESAYRLPAEPTVMDALAGPSAGRLTRAALAKHHPRMRTVTDAEALAGVAEAFRSLRLVVEPGGAASLAAVLGDPAAFECRTVVLVASGGNIDAAVLARALATVS